MKPVQRILFVCTGNLCRSPLAQGLMVRAVEMRGLAAAFQIESAGTHARVGAPPDPLAIAVASDYDADISGQRARLLNADDFREFDQIVALDLGHLDHLRFMQPTAAPARLRLLLAGMAGSGDAEVPDPYGGDRREFEYAARLIEVGVRHLVEELVEGADA
jgi:protein-tyrosine phosphatase